MYFVYILQCSDSTFYTGITTNLDRRVKEHNNSKLGAKYTKARRPVKLIYSQEFNNRSEALIEEAKIKKLSRTEKLNLIIIETHNHTSLLNNKIIL
jgi:putative endonuclease